MSCGICPLRGAEGGYGEPVAQKACKWCKTDLRAGASVCAACGRAHRGGTVTPGFLVALMFTLFVVVAGVMFIANFNATH